MKASVLALCLGLGMSSLSSAALGEAPGVTRPMLVGGAVTPTAGACVAGADGAEWVLPGGARIVAEHGAELRVVGVPQKLALGPRHNTPGYTVLLRSGDVRVSVPRDGRSAVVVAAPRKTNVLVISGSASIRATSVQDRKQRPLATSLSSQTRG